MATVLQGVLTNAGRAALAKSFGQIGGFNSCFASSFKYGTGGYTVTVGGNIPKVPDPSLIDIEGPLFADKPFIAGDFRFIPDSTIEVRAKLNPSDFNDDGSGGSFKFYELGIYDLSGVMIAYTTFPEQTKTATKSLITYIQITF